MHSQIYLIKSLIHHNFKLCTNGLKLMIEEALYTRIIPPTDLLNVNFTCNWANDSQWCDLGSTKNWKRTKKRRHRHSGEENPGNPRAISPRKPENFEFLLRIWGDPPCKRTCHGKGRMTEINQGSIGSTNSGAFFAPTSYTSMYKTIQLPSSIASTQFRSNDIVFMYYGYSTRFQQLQSATRKILHP